MSTTAAMLAGRGMQSPADYGPVDTATEVSDAIHARDAKRLAAALKEHYAFSRAVEPTPTTASN